MTDPTVAVIKLCFLTLACILLGFHSHSLQVGVSIFLLGIFVWECCVPIGERNRTTPKDEDSKK